MSGLQFKLDQNFEYGTTVSLDERLNEGSLILLEPARDAVTGIPTELVNYAASTAATILGSAVDSVLIQNTMDIVDGAFVERTSKGALHGVFPAAPTAMETRASFGAVIPQSLIDYMLANASHSFYMSVFGIITRNTTAGTGSKHLAGVRSAPLNPATVSETALSIYQAQSSFNVAGGRTGTSLLGRTVNTPTPTWHADVAQKNLVFVTPPYADTSHNEFFTFGAPDRILADSQGVPSWVCYSVYVEDLTVSGQTYAQAHAKSQEVFENRFGTGGIYANDTWTIPA